ncbi:hypothetical protein LEMLEM_LOCUS10461 [Lemmus lemmus]
MKASPAQNPLISRCFGSVCHHVSAVTYRNQKRAWHQIT